jgi:hypothetical protein
MLRPLLSRKHSSRSQVVLVLIASVEEFVSAIICGSRSFQTRSSWGLPAIFLAVMSCFSSVSGRVTWRKNAMSRNGRPVSLPLWRIVYSDLFSAYKLWQQSSHFALCNQ